MRPIPGDILPTIDGQPLTTHDVFANRIGLVALDSRISLTLLRRGRELSVSSRLRELDIERLRGADLSTHLRGVVLGEVRYRALT